MANPNGSLAKGEKLMPEVTETRKFTCPECGMTQEAATPTAVCNGVQIGVFVKLPKSKDKDVPDFVVYTDGTPVDHEDSKTGKVLKRWIVPDGPVVLVNSKGDIFSHDGQKKLNPETLVWERNQAIVNGNVPEQHASAVMEVTK